MEAVFVKIYLNLKLPIHRHFLRFEEPVQGWDLVFSMCINND